MKSRYAGQVTLKTSIARYVASLVSGGRRRNIRATRNARKNHHRSSRRNSNL